MEDKEKKERKKRTTRRIASILLILLLVGVFGISKYQSAQVKKISVTEFENVLDSKQAKNIKEIALYDNTGVMRYKIDKKEYEVKLPMNYIKENSKMVETFKEKKIKFTVKTEQNLFSTFANVTRVLFTLLIIYFLYKIAEDYFKKIEIEEVKGEKITFEDVAGSSSVKTEFKDIIDYYKDPHANKDFKEDLPKGILLEGPPGNGKTYFAKALAGECGIPFFQKSASDLEGKYVGVGSENIGKLFTVVRQRAKEAGGAILFLDELDSIAAKREMRTVVETTQTINKLLTEMDGFAKDSNVIIIAATNLVSSLDEAVIRPGRFDRIIHIGKPTFEERKEVLSMYLNKKKERVEEEVYKEDFVATLAKISEGFSNAKLANLIKESSVLARRKGKTTIGIQELREGFTKIVAGVKRNEALDENDKKVVAYHEAGHAVAQILTSPLGVNGVAYITITPYGQSLGHVSPISPESRIYEKRKSSLEKQVMVMLAGRAVEDKLLSGDYTVGAANDLYQANQILLQYVVKFGMAESEENLFINELDENTPLVRRQVKHIRERLYRETKTLIERHFDIVEKIANHLIEHESIEQYELTSLLKNTSFPNLEEKQLESE
ncbi:hypothetical protein CN918_32200 [Priestia megaterium]|nr:hypothetical protein CN918_32200 [Priestia megaterium]